MKYKEPGVADEFVVEQQLKTMTVKAWWCNNPVMNSNMAGFDSLTEVTTELALVHLCSNKSTHSGGVTYTGILHR